jgi:hypothetical protein
MCDCVVVDAACIEPVSTSKFPANREINSEFRGNRPSAAILGTQSASQTQSFTARIPCATEQGIFKLYQGKFFDEQGIFTRDASILNFEHSASYPACIVGASTWMNFIAARPFEAITQIVSPRRRSVWRA